MGNLIRAARAGVLSLALCLCGTYLVPPPVSADGADGPGDPTVIFPPDPSPTR